MYFIILISIIQLTLAFRYSSVQKRDLCTHGKKLMTSIMFHNQHEVPSRIKDTFQKPLFDGTALIQPEKQKLHDVLLRKVLDIFKYIWKNIRSFLNYFAAKFRKPDDIASVIKDPVLPVIDAIDSTRGTSLPVKATFVEYRRYSPKKIEVKMPNPKKYAADKIKEIEFLTNKKKTNETILTFYTSTPKAALGISIEEEIEWQRLAAQEEERRITQEQVRLGLEAEAEERAIRLATKVQTDLIVKDDEEKASAIREEELRALREQVRLGLEAEAEEMAKRILAKAKGSQIEQNTLRQEAEAWAKKVAEEKEEQRLAAESEAVRVAEERYAIKLAAAAEAKRIAKEQHLQKLADEEAKRLTEMRDFRKLAAESEKKQLTAGKETQRLVIESVAQITVLEKESLSLPTQSDIDPKNVDQPPVWNPGSLLTNERAASL